MNVLSVNQLNEISEHVGKPYKIDAKGPESFGCSGLVSYLYTQLFGFSIVIQPSERRNFIQVYGTIQQLGDVLFFRTGTNLHVGMAIDKIRMIHADEDLGVIVERFRSEIWAQRLKNTYRHRYLL